MPWVHGGRAIDHDPSDAIGGQNGTVVRYLSLEWIDAVAANVATNDRLGDLADQHEIGFTQVVSDGPEGDVIYHLQVGDGRIDFAAGPAVPEHVRMEQSWDTAVAVATGELNAQEAFVNGHIRLFGDQQRLLDSQPVFGALDSVFSAVRDQTVYE
jgi:putative sterol carrier protein